MSDTRDLIEQKITKILDHIGVSAKVAVEPSEEGSFKATLTGEDLGLVIGYHGEGLSSLQNIVSLLVAKDEGEYKHIRIDINGYRSEREEKIKDIVKNSIDKVRFTLGPVELAPMTAEDRRLVHMEMQDYDDVISESTGEGYNRRVVIKPKS